MQLPNGAQLPSARGEHSKTINYYNASRTRITILLMCAQVLFLNVSFQECEF
jgi:hypothetical protein